MNEAKVAGLRGGQSLAESARERGVFYANVPPIIDPERRRHMAELGKNWDGYKGNPPTEAALKVLDSVALVPTATGGWQIEVNANGQEATVEVSAEGEIWSAGWWRHV